MANNRSNVGFKVEPAEQEDLKQYKENHNYNSIHKAARGAMRAELGREKSQRNGAEARAQARLFLMQLMAAGIGLAIAGAIGAIDFWDGFLSALGVGAVALYLAAAMRSGTFEKQERSLRDWIPGVWG